MSELTKSFDDDDVYSQIAKRVAEYKKTSEHTNTDDLDDLSISLADVFFVDKSEVKLIINQIMETDLKELSPRDLILDKCIKSSKSIILFLILAFIASYLIL